MTACMAVLRWGGVFFATKRIRPLSQSKGAFRLHHGREMGRAEGIEQATRRNILSFYKNNVPVSLIATSVGKSEAEVQEIIRQGQTETPSC